MRLLRLYTISILISCVIAVMTGCSAMRRRAKPEAHISHSQKPPASCVAEYDTLDQPAAPDCREFNAEALEAIGPRTVAELPDAFQDVTIEEVVAQTLQNSDVVRDLGGRILQSPESTVTRYDIGIEYADPQFGVEAALSAFDANLATQFSYEKNDRVFNNLTLGGGAQELRQDLALMQTELSKVAAAGTRMSLRSNVFHDRNNRGGNLFGHLWESQWEAEMRQPLLQGAGIAFNRIAGPNGQPGLRFSNGIVIAQLNNDMSKVDFELSIRQLISDVEDAYWQLFRAYHEYGVRQETRDAAEQTWKSVEAKYERGLSGGEADKEAQARAQFYRYQDLTMEALNGTATSPGVYEAERRLRLLMGLASRGESLLRPSSTVPEAPLVYDWPSLSAYALENRAELRKQLWKVRQEELLLVAAKNFVLPRLDATALYRLRGFGDDLFGNDGTRFSSAARDMANLDHQEWQFGLEFNVPIGRRQAYAGVRHAELRLARERKILQEQELQVSHELANAIARSVQAHSSLEASRQRMLAAQQRAEATDASYEADKVPLDLVLDAQERLGLAESRYFEVLVNYAVADRDVRRAAGHLLPSNGVVLQGDCPETYCSKPIKKRDQIDYRCQIPRPTTAGPRVQSY